MVKICVQGVLRKYVVVMKVKDLLLELSQLPPEANEWELVVACGFDLQFFKPLECVSVGRFHGYTGYDGQFDEAEAPSDSDNAICLWPVG